MTKEAQANTLVMVNLDSLIAGDNAYVYSGDGEGRNIRDWLLDWAENEEVPLQIQTGENPEYPPGTTGDWSDHAPFKHVGIPFIYFESTNWLLGKRDGYTQVDQRFGRDGEIWHTEYDHLVGCDFDTYMRDLIRRMLTTLVFEEIEKRFCSGWIINCLLGEGLA